jgi:hypothetical protein
MRVIKFMEFLLPLLLTLPPSAGALISVGLGLGVTISVSFFLIAYAMQNPQMNALAKEELSALFFTVFIILFWLASDTLLNGVVFGLMTASLPSSVQGFINPSACVSGTGAGCLQGLTYNHLTLAIASLDVLDNKLRSQYIDLYLFEALIGFLSTVSFPIGSPLPGVNIVSFSLSPFTGLALLSSAHTTIVEMIGLMLTLVWAKKFVLIFARDTIPILLLPFGVVLRAVPFFRKTGSSVIAVAFAFYFVLPFAFILSNYLIFDIYKPADFAYTPSSASFFDTDKSASYWENTVKEARGGTDTQHMLDEFNSKDVVEETYDDPTDACSGNFVVRIFCSIKNIFSTAYEAASSFVGTVINIWKFMVGMTGDFFLTAFNNPLMPESASAGLYFFIIKEVTIVSPFIILVILTTVIEIVMTVTMYRNIALLIGGEAELIGLTKIV